MTSGAPREELCVVSEMVRIGGRIARPKFEGIAPNFVSELIAGHPVAYLTFRL